MTLSAGGAAAGAAWMTGMAIAARGWRPRISVLGGDDWQVVLLERGTARLMLLVGTFTESPERQIERVCGLLRQHLDVVAGTGQALALLPSGFRRRRSVSTVIAFDPPPMAGRSAAYSPLDRALTVALGEVRVIFSPITHASPFSTLSWVAEIESEGLSVAIAPTLDLIAAHARVATTLAVAPAGDIGLLWRTMPGIVVATNTSTPVGDLRTSVRAGASMATPLVRTFPEDVAAFTFRSGRLALPNWAEGLAGPDTDA